MIKLSISEGNRKIGRTPSVSLPPLVTCAADAPCRNDCYANKHAYLLYRRTRAAWDRNWELWKTDPGDYWTQVQAYLTYRQPPFFRWHVGGEIPDQKYARMIATIAALNKATEFLVYTTTDYLDMTKIDNLHVIRSQWIGQQVDTHRRKFIVVDKGQTVHGFTCPGKCETCRECWSSNEFDIYIEKH